MIFAREKMDTARPSVVTLTRRVSIEKISDGIFFFLLLLFFFFWSTRASLSLECGACIYTSLMEREEGEKHSRTRWRRGPILLAVGRLQRGNKGVHCRVYRALYATTTRRRAESTLDSGFPYSVLMSRRLCRP